MDTDATTTDDTAFGELLRAYRRSAGLTPEALAAGVGAVRAPAHRTRAPLLDEAIRADPADG